MNRVPEVSDGSGNIFADLDLPDSEELLAKARLVHRISEIAEERGWIPADVAEALGIDQRTASNLLRGHLDEFSIERMFRFLNALGQEVEISVRESRSRTHPAGLIVRTG